jgi:hypothetical protein
MDAEIGYDEHGPAYPAPSSDGLFAKLSEGEYSLDGGETWNKGDFNTAIMAAINHVVPPKLTRWQQFKKGFRRGYDNGKGSPLLSIALTILILAVLFFLFSAPAPAMDHGFNPNDPATKWFELKMRPDLPESKCCGKADAYPVSHYQKNDNGTYTVWLADGSALKYPDGITRKPFDIETPIIVPSELVNKLEDDLDNPTDVGWIFMQVNSPTNPGLIFCFIRHPEGN